MTGTALGILPAGRPPDDYREVYQRDGFVAVDLFPADEVRRMRQMVADLLARRVTGDPRLRLFAASEEPVPGIDPANPDAGMTSARRARRPGSLLPPGGPADRRGLSTLVHR